MSGRLDRPLRPELRPRLRGVSHQYMAVVALALGVGLVAAAPGAEEIVTCAVFALSQVALFAVSAFYHRVTWRSPQTRERARRADHSTIFLAIAGTYTPIAAVGIDTGTAILVLVWVGAAAGIAIRLLFSDAPRWVTTGPYIALGWVSVLLIPAAIDELGWVPVLLLGLGGVLYTVGGVTYARRKPDPWPRTFGYHEIFHALVIVAALLQYAVIAFWVLPG